MNCLKDKAELKNKPRIRLDMKEIYILLTNSHTLISKAIYYISKAEYTHAALAMDKDLTMLYSFGRKFKYSMFPSGFVREGVNHGVMGDSDTMKCALYAITISDRCYKKLANRLRHMEAKKHCYRFNYLGLPMCGFGKKSGGRNVFFCSQFICHVLNESGAIETSKHPSLTRPVDFEKLHKARCIFRGPICELRDFTF
ncbi:MAG: hypothetical protein IJB73_00530 [Firmicutes bacterium]|nr:hypothetical protein [Bacillota bacterium]